MRARHLVATLSLSAAAFVGILTDEHYTQKAIIPVQGDVPTVGFGSTTYENGAKVKMGDTITPVRAVILAQAHVSKDEEAFRATLPGVALYQEEYDLYLDYTYQYGIGNWRASSMRQHLLKGEYQAACDALLQYRFVKRYDCSTPGNKRCYGVWTRQLKRHQKCMEVQ